MHLLCLKPNVLQEVGGEKPVPDASRVNRSKSLQEMFSSNMGWKLFLSLTALAGFDTKITVAGGHILGMVW